MAYKKIIDVSTFDTASKNIDWNKVKADGIVGAIVRGGYSTTVDEDFKVHMAGAIGVGLHVGVYWFSYAYTPQMAKEEAEFCLKTIAPYKQYIDMPIWYDAEGDTLNYAKKKLGYSLSDETINSMAIAFCDTIQSNGYTAGLYFNKDWRNNVYFPSTISKYCKWYAYYNSKLDWSYADLWQYTSTAEIDGVYPSAEDVSYLLNEKIIADAAPLDPPEIPDSADGKLVISGLWGETTTRKAQKVFSTTVDGIISRQPQINKQYLPCANEMSWKFYSQRTDYAGGSQLIKAIENFLYNRGYYTGTIDGWFGKGCVTALQKFLRTKGFYNGTIDGIMGSVTVRGFQNWLNKN